MILLLSFSLNRRVWYKGLLSHVLEKSNHSNNRKKISLYVNKAGQITENVFSTDDHRLNLTYRLDY